MTWFGWESAIHGTGLFDWKNGPYTDYYANQTIHQINMFAFIIDVALSSLCIFKIFFKDKNYWVVFIQNFLLACGIFLIWFELYHGSTIYYGEIRDKQMLPICTNNFGIFGSIIFLASLLQDSKSRCPWVLSIFFNLSSVYLTKDWLDF